jgi:hypothetical protein
MKTSDTIDEKRKSSGFLHEPDKGDREQGDRRRTGIGAVL